MIDLKENWGIEQQSMEPLECQKNPLSTSREWVVNNEFILKETIARPDNLLLRQLKELGVPIVSPKGWKSVKQGKHYQLFPYLKSDKRPDYSSHGQAKSISDAINLIATHRSDEQYSVLSSLELAYCIDAPERVIEHLENRLIPYMPYMEKRFSHGDLHPANILFEGDKIHAVIDWEAGGMREELFDVAFLLGCAGMDNPNNLKSPWAKSLLQNITMPTKLSYSLLPELMLATRLPWLKIWESEPEILEMEKEFMGIVLDNIEDIRSLWLSWAGDFRYSSSRWFMQDAHLTKDIEAARQRKDRTLEQEATDARLLAIDYGMKDDILSVISSLNSLRRLSRKHPKNKHVQVEYSLAMGNASLDMSKFRLHRGMRQLKRDYESHMARHPHEEVRIGFSFIIRNFSILAAETGRQDESDRLVCEQADYASSHGHIEIQGEFARTLSNAVTTALSRNQMEKAQDLFKQLSELNSNHKSQKIDVAYRVARANMEKSAG